MTTLEHWRKSPRIPEFDYRGPLIGHLVTVTRLCRPLFTDATVTKVCTTALEEASSKFNATIWAYCLMPDHAHILVKVAEGESLSEFMRHFKQISSFRAKRLTGGSLWQISYYDRLLRKPEAILDVARYIWENPVRAGLVENRLDYPHSGPREAMEG
jgi:putative transposase